MLLLKTLCSLFIEALFPIPLAEQWIFNTPKEDIFKILPRAYRSPISESFSIFSYKDERVWRLIWSIKYKKSKEASALVGFALHRFIKIFAQIVPNSTESNATITNIIIIPMPVSKQRRRERGFNQCELLTAEIEKFEAKDKILIINNLLLRSRHTSRQTLKDKSHRQKSAQGLFEVDKKILDSKFKNQNGVKDATFIIIDDVVTTGSTMKEAVLTMRKVGFQNTWGLSVAH